VDPFQLQILCRRLNERRARARKATISMEQLGGNRGMGKRIRAYYREVCRSIPVVRPGWNARKWRLSATNFVLFNLPRLAARQLCEQGLLILPAGFRNTLAEIVIGRHYGVGTRDLTRLTDRKLLRMEPRLGNQRFYEISHDSLVPTLNEARFTRRVGSIAALAVLVFALPLYHQAESRYEEWQEAVEAQRHAEETERTADQLERQIAAWQAQTAAPGSAERADDWSIALTTYRDLDIEPERRQRNLQELADRLRAALNDTSLNDAQRELAVKRYAALPIELRPAESKLVNEEKAKSKLSFSKVELQGRLDFRGVTLRDISFVGARLDSCVARRDGGPSEAACSSFYGATLENIDFSSAYVRQADFRQATIRNSTFIDADASTADFSGSTIEQVLFARSRLQNGVLRGAKLIGTRFLRSDAEQMNLERAELHGAQFVATPLRGASFRNAVVTSAGIIQSDVEGADFGGVDTEKVDFAGTAWWLAINLSDGQRRNLTARFPVAAYAQSEDYRNGVRSRREGVSVSGSASSKATALNRLAWYRATRGAELAFALNDIDAALMALPGDSSFLDTKAFILMQQGRFSEALETLAQSLGFTSERRTVDTIVTPIPEHIYRYALCLAWLGRRAEAQPFFDRARAMGYRESYELVLVGLPRH
jgi:uncharacterized protein YjbI with pentapeptide repeats